MQPVPPSSVSPLGSLGGAWRKPQTCGWGPPERSREVAGAGGTGSRVAMSPSTQEVLWALPCADTTSVARTRARAAWVHVAGTIRHVNVYPACATAGGSRPGHMTWFLLHRWRVWTGTSTFVFSLFLSFL